MVIRADELNQLRRYLILGYPVSEICHHLKIPRSTFYRYMKKIKKEDEVMIKKDAHDKMIVALQIFHDRIGQTVMHMTELESDTKKPDFVRMNAARIKLEASWAQVILQGEGPRILAQFPQHIQKYAKGQLQPTEFPKSLTEQQQQQQPGQEQEGQRYYSPQLGDLSASRPVPPIPDEPPNNWRPPMPQRDDEEEQRPDPSDYDEEPDDGTEDHRYQQQQRRRRQI